MIGVFDSGVGGMCAYREIRRLMPTEDAIYLADRKNAPYGTKAKDEIIELTKNDILRLRRVGARKILIACCTASSVWNELPSEYRDISLPIIKPTAEIAAREGKRIAVIATEHTVRADAFGREIRSIAYREVFSYAEQELVALVEGGCRDGMLSDRCREKLAKIKERLIGIDADTLILGCTHFSHLERSLKALLPSVRILSPAKIGAYALFCEMKKSPLKESGRIIYT